MINASKCNCKGERGLNELTPAEAFMVGADLAAKSIAAIIAKSAEHDFDRRDAQKLAAHLSDRKAMMPHYTTLLQVAAAVPLVVHRRAATTATIEKLKKACNG